MQEILFDYRLNPCTWAYISALMMIGTYFKFRRLWSVRNLDLVGLIAFSPALLLLYYGLDKQVQEPARAEVLIQAGYIWLFVISGFFLVRMLLDPMMVRRPMLEPNLSAGGLTFTGVSLLIFLMANVITCPLERLERRMASQEAPSQRNPGFQPFFEFSNSPVPPIIQLSDSSDQENIPVDPSRPEANRKAMLLTITARAVTIAAHLALVVGMVWIGFRHFGNIHTGVAVASLYLLLPYTAQMTPRVDHVIPAALLVWAVEAYRRPVVAGVFLGLAAGVIYYPLFLLPLWCGFYWRRGLIRFLVGVVSVLLLLSLSLVLTSSSLASFLTQFQQMFGWTSLSLANVVGFWQDAEPLYRIPAFAAFVVLCGSLALWPPQKNYGTLLSCSAAVMLGTQFWHAPDGGIYMNWYLPLLLLTIFRPNLEDRVALTAVTESRIVWRGRP